MRSSGGYTVRDRIIGSPICEARSSRHILKKTRIMTVQGPPVKKLCRSRITTELVDIEKDLQEVGVSLLSSRSELGTRRPE
jgi:hypothetical protein